MMAPANLNLNISVALEPTKQLCLVGAGGHRFELAPTTGAWLLLFCTQCGMMLDVRLQENASGS